MHSKASPFLVNYAFEMFINAFQDNFSYKQIFSNRRIQVRYLLRSIGVNLLLSFSGKNFRFPVLTNEWKRQLRRYCLDSGHDFSFIWRSSLYSNISLTSQFIHKRWNFTTCYTVCTLVKYFLNLLNLSSSRIRIIERLVINCKFFLLSWPSQKRLLFF